jgi:uncharacterized glyoxalase superfamily protein PhnB
MTQFKPDGYPELSPYLLLDDPEASLDFIARMFNGERLRIITGEAGRIIHGEIRIGDTVVMMGGAMAGWPAQQASFHYYVPDVDAVYARALELGATSVQAPLKQADADKRGAFKDPGGIVWWVATQIDAN